jgi:hypothetical protein
MLEFLKILSGFLTPLIAIIVTYIAYQQYKINKNRLRLYLFEKRFKVYDGLMIFLASVIRKADTSNEDLFKFRKHINDAFFLFDDEILSFLEEVYKKAHDLKGLQIKLRNIDTPSDEEAKEIVEKSLKIQGWLDKQFISSNKIFEKYLRFK